MLRSVAPVESGTHSRSIGRGECGGEREMSAPRSAVAAIIDGKNGLSRMFRTAAGIATVLVGLNSKVVAQYSQAYPREAVPPVVTTQELPPINAPAVEEGYLPSVGAGPLPSGRPPRAYQTGSYPNLSSQDYGAGPHDLRGAIQPGPPGSAKQDAIREQAMRARQQNNSDQVGSAATDGSLTNRDAAAKMAPLPPEVRPQTETKEELPHQFRRTLVDYGTTEPAGTIIIDTPNTYLYLVLGGGKALRYGVGVGREGFTWSGVERVTRMLEWPDWTPPEEMIVRQPYLPRFVAGGETSPLGARALYLGNTIYRIHGTNQPWTIGTSVSSGCIRLTNEDVMDLYRRVKVGTRVVVLPGSPPVRDSFAPVSARPTGNASILISPAQSVLSTTSY
jgi:lipoprotein-anchoring transpeptidase ErfK/SrfK